jgi:hypothetical protein
MKIVDRKTFLALPAGVVYAKCAPWVFDGLCIKGDTIYANVNNEAIDFFYFGIGADSIAAHDSGEWGELLDASLETGRELAMSFDIQGRDGCFEDDQLFAVFSEQDVKLLIERLSRSTPT